MLDPRLLSDKCRHGLGFLLGHFELDIFVLANVLNANLGAKGSENGVVGGVHNLQDGRELLAGGSESAALAVEVERGRR